MLRNADMGVGGVKFSREKRYEGVRFNVISVTRGWVGVQIPGKKRYVTLEWPLTATQSTSLFCAPKLIYERWRLSGSRICPYGGATI